jgi:hypothetical protein
MFIWIWIELNQTAIVIFWWGIITHDFTKSREFEAKPQVLLDDKNVVLRLGPVKEWFTKTKKGQNKGNETPEREKERELNNENEMTINGWKYLGMNTGTVQLNAESWKPTNLQYIVNIATLSVWIVLNISSDQEMNEAYEKFIGSLPI